MNVKTHKRIAEVVYDGLDPYFQERISKKYFQKGAGFPDLNLVYRFISHSYEGSFNILADTINKIITKKLGPKELGFNLGIISHLMSDYACAYHSNPKHSKINLKHRQHELRIVDELDCLINPPKGPEFSSLDTFQEELEHYLEYNHSEDVNPDHKRDLVHAFSLTKSLSELILEEYKAQEELSHDTSKKRIAIFSDTYYPNINGVSDLLYNYMKHLKETNTPYVLVAPRNKFVLWNKETGFNIHKMKPRHFPFKTITRSEISKKRKLHKMLDDFQPDVIHMLTEFTLGNTGMKYAKKRGIPLVFNYSTT